jgi:ribosome-associated protein
MAPLSSSPTKIGSSPGLLVHVTLPITLGQFVKLAGLASSGGEAKHAIGTGDVRVNGEVDTRRGRQLAAGDTIQFGGQYATVAADTAPDP